MYNEPIFSLYAVRNKEGKWFRAKGYGGGGQSWVDDISKAKVYPKISQARSRVTFFYNNYPQFGMPTLVKLDVCKMTDIIETERVKKAASDKKEKELFYAQQCVIRDVERKQQEINRLQKELQKLKR